MADINLSKKEAEEMHYRFLTDRQLQQIYAEISMMMTLFVPSYYLTDEGLRPVYKPEDLREIKRVEKLRDAYIQAYYPELILN